MPFPSYTFKPKLLPTLAFIILLPILISLGFWQLDRMQQKQTLFGALHAGQEQTAQAFTVEPTPYSNIRVSGQFLQKFSIFLEHQSQDNKPGYHVLTPLVIKPDLPWLWVNRGFIPINNDFNPQEQLEPLLEFEGLVYYPSENRFILGENFSKTPQGILKIQRMDAKALSQHFQHAFYPFVLLQNPDAPEGFIRDWQIKTMAPSQHLGYAVQWFALAGTLIVLYIIVNLRRKSKK